MPRRVSVPRCFWFALEYIYIYVFLGLLEPVLPPLEMDPFSLLES